MGGEGNVNINKVRQWRKHAKVVSSELIRFKLPPQEDCKAGVSSVKPSLERKELIRKREKETNHRNKAVPSISATHQAVCSKGYVAVSFQWLVTREAKVENRYVASPLDRPRESVFQLNN